MMTEHLEAPSTPEDGSGGGKDMLVGALVCIAGALLTYFSYQSAATRAGGGTYRIFYGAVIFGALRFFRGIAR
jgi:hypothetical protein